MQKLGLGWSVLGVSSLGLALSACGGSQEAAPPPATPAAEAAPASAAPDPASAKTLEVVFQPKSGSQLSGKATLSETPEGVKVALALEGLPPGEHGAHVHEKGDCSSGDGMSAGGHFNPAGKTHGAQGAEHHAGDLPNLRADASGNARADFEIGGIAVGSGSADIVGKGLIVHRDPDDYKSQPAGNAGPRLACAVIKAA